MEKSRSNIPTIEEILDYSKEIRPVMENYNLQLDNARYDALDILRRKDY